MIGGTLGRFRITEKIGEGGMGVVYRAFDTRLNRTVALKVLPAALLADESRKQRFVQEAIASSALNHPHIITTYDIDAVDGVDFIAMEYVEGQSLDRVIQGQPLPVERVIDYAAQLAGALAAAHRAGIVHRDIKPANLMIGNDGRLRVLDFGVAKLAEHVPAGADAATLEAPRQTSIGTIVGTAAYMAPEQAEGRRVTPAADVFAVGVVAYEMLTGQRAFRGSSEMATIASVLRDEPPPLSAARPETPPALAAIVAKCLEKDPTARYPTAVELVAALEAVHHKAHLPATRGRLQTFAIAAAVAIVASLSAVTWWSLRQSRARESERGRMSQIEQLIAEQRTVSAFRRLREAQRVLPDDPGVKQLEQRLLFPESSVATDPPGARVEIQDYFDPNSAWETLGETPVTGPLPFGHMRLRATKAGFEPLVVGYSIATAETLKLFPAGARPPGMVFVPGGTAQYSTSPSVKLAPYWIDEYEVTNADFKRFVDAGGYRMRDDWKHPFIVDGKTISWETAMAAFVDPTGRPGPATWELGTFAEGKEKEPVAGISWYEAAAYAAFAGKQLPSIYHWYRAAGLIGPALFSDVLQASNFGGKGVLPAGAQNGLGPFGTYAMAGNVKEWCFTETEEGRRFVPGGAWSEPAYMFADFDAQPPFDRRSTFGLRLIKPASDERHLSYDTPEFAPFTRASRDLASEKRPDDETFAAFKRLYAYDQTPLAATTERSEVTPWWRKETVSFAAAYGGERVLAYVFVPLNADPPYHAVVHLPGAYARDFKSSADLSVGIPFFDFIVRSGRVVIFPVLKDTYERQVTGPSGPNAARDLTIQWAKDVFRSLDYLESRADIAKDKFAFVGLSMGANEAAVYAAIEPRFKAVVAMASGLNARPRLPEVEAANFAPRVTTPFLMINGRQDFMRPYQTSQLGLYKLLGPPEPHKRLASHEGGHLPSRAPMIKETLDWLDRYLGSVQTR